jgi:hypothetical protein
MLSVSVDSVQSEMLSVIQRRMRDSKCTHSDDGSNDAVFSCLLYQGIILVESRMIVYSNKHCFCSTVNITRHN